MCPWNRKFSQALADDSPFRVREFIAGKDAVTLSRELLAMSQAEFSAAFKGSPMKRAKLRGLQRNAAVALRNVGTTDDLAALEAGRSQEHALVCEHAESARRRIEAYDNAGARTDVA